MCSLSSLVLFACKLLPKGVLLRSLTVIKEPALLRRPTVLKRV